MSFLQALPISKEAYLAALKNGIYDVIGVFPGTPIFGIDEKYEVGKSQEAKENSHCLDSFPETGRIGCLCLVHVYRINCTVGGIFFLRFPSPVVASPCVLVNRDVKYHGHRLILILTFAMSIY